MGSTKLDPVDAFVALAGGERKRLTEMSCWIACVRSGRSSTPRCSRRGCSPATRTSSTVLSDEQTFETLSEGRGAPIYGRSLIQWRGREHNKKAGPVVKRIRSPRAFSTGVDEMVQRIAVEVADRLPFGVEIDFRQDYAMWIPLISITDAARHR